MQPPHSGEIETQSSSVETGNYRAAPRIAICTVGELFGGVERHVLALLRELQNRGVKPLLLLFHDSELAELARDEGVVPVILPSSNVRLLQTAHRIARILEQCGIKLVHVHGYKAMVFCAIARYWHHFALVRTEHGLPELMSAGLFGALCTRLYGLLDEAAVRITRPRVCYVTKELQLHHLHAHARCSTSIIPNGVLSLNPHLLPRPPEFHDGWFNIAVVGRLDAVKGLQFAVCAAAAEGMSPDVHLHLVGVGPCEAELRLLAEQQGVTERVHFLGFRRNVYDFIAHCDVLAMPSLHEGLPYTLLEAMALGTPVIASRVGGLAEVLQDENTALLVPPRDVNALAEAVRRLKDNRELGLRLGMRAKQVQQKRYSIEAMTESYLALYRALASGD